MSVVWKSALGKRTVRAAMETLTQKKPVDLAARFRNRVGNDHIHRDVVGPFMCQRRDYLNCAGFSNEVEKLGIKPSAIAALPNGDRGFRLAMNSDSGRQYEVEVTGGHARLGIVNAPRTTRTLLAQGSASAESTWTQFAAIIRQKEGK